MSISAPRRIPAHKGVARERRYRMAASTTIYAGDLVMINSAGLAVPCAAAASNVGIRGIANETVTSDGSTAAYIKVLCGTQFRLPGTSLTQAMVGTRVYGLANSTIGATDTNLPVAGMLEEYISATEGWCSIGSEYAA